METIKNSFPVTANVRSLTDQETNEAFGVQSVNAWPKVNRRVVDPVAEGTPQYVLFSFVKAPGCTPDESGFYGVAKIRSQAFHTVEEAHEKAKQIIKDVDSTNSIFTCRVGHPFPLVETGHAQTTDEIDVYGSKIEKAIAENVKEKRTTQRQEMKEIKEREAALRNDVSHEMDPEEKYVEQRVKLAHIRYALEEHKRKEQECRELENTCKKWLVKQKKKHPTYEQTYFDRYLEARKQAGIPDDAEMSGFMKFMKDPIMLLDA